MRHLRWNSYRTEHSPRIPHCDWSTPQLMTASIETIRKQLLITEKPPGKKDNCTSIHLPRTTRSWRFHQSAVILLLVLAASFTAHGQPEDIKPRYEKFLNQHLGPDMTEKKCDSEIKHRKISDSKTPNGCKEVNTFIKANKHQINAVCDKGGTPQSNGMIKSNQPFPVITCKLKSSENKRKCEYRGNKSTRYIVVKCEKGWPVHYDEGIVNVTG
ncbi:ribonuclease-like 3 [Labeo rohita]|uniref:ribonuclease-like 3 n=1 Tax=Labeo rohita TaxID=84645 RepID=UPI0021E21C88|nr:ribonuclease-like 3 [Labeo rohita]